MLLTTVAEIDVSGPPPIGTTRYFRVSIEAKTFIAPIRKMCVIFFFFIISALRNKALSGTFSSPFPSRGIRLVAL